MLIIIFVFGRNYDASFIMSVADAGCFCPRNIDTNDEAKLMPHSAQHVDQSTMLIFLIPK